MSKVNGDEDKEKWRFSGERKGWRNAEEVVVHTLTTAKRIVYALEFVLFFFIFSTGLKILNQIGIRSGF